MNEEPSVDNGMDVEVSAGEETQELDQPSLNPETPSEGVQSSAQAQIGQNKRKRRLTSNVWKNFRMLPPDENGKLFCEYIKCGQQYPGSSKAGTGNLHRHIKQCTRMTTKDIGQYMISTANGKIETKKPQFDQEYFRELVIRAIVRHDLPFSIKIVDLILSWGIATKVFSITLDNAAANDKCVELLVNKIRLEKGLVCNGVLFHVRCCAHILNLIVQDGLKELDGAVVKIRECVKYVKGSQGRKERFANVCSQNLLDTKKGLCQDVPTRWNSTYKMLTNAMYYRLAFSHLSLLDSNFQWCPSNEEWEKVEKICEFLKVFYDATLEFSGSLYPTASLYFPQVFLIHLKLLEVLQSPDECLRSIANKMWAKFKKYWSDFNLLFAIAVVFDPRYKFQFLEFAYRKLYGVSSTQLQLVKNTLVALFDEYENATKKSTNSSSSGSELNSQRVDDVNNPNQSILKEFDEFDDEEYSTSTPKTQLEMYLEEPKAKRTKSINVLEFWRSQQYRYPELTRLATDILCVPVSTVASEAAFSVGGRILDQYRSSMSTPVVEALLCTRDWLFTEKALSEDELGELTKNIMALSIDKDESSSNKV